MNTIAEESNRKARNICRMKLHAIIEYAKGFPTHCKTGTLAVDMARASRMLEGMVEWNNHTALNVVDDICASLEEYLQRTRAI